MHECQQEIFKFTNYKYNYNNKLQTVIASILTFIAPWMSVPAYFVLITLNIAVGRTFLKDVWQNALLIVIQ